jgi:hypothetical protein
MSSSVRPRRQRQLPYRPDTELTRIDRPDFAMYREEAAQAVAAELGPIADPVEILRQAVATIAEVDTEIDGDEANNIPGVKAERDAAALSLWAYGYVRGIELSMGVAKNAWVKMRRNALNLAPGEGEPAATDRAAAARAAGIREIPDAAEELPRHAVQLECARARRSEAQRFRDAAVKVLRAAPYSWSQEQTAEFIGRAPSLVSWITGKDAEETR